MKSEKLELETLLELFYNANDMIFVIDIDNTKIVYANEMFLDKFEYSKKDLETLDISQIRKPLENKPFKQICEDIKKSKKSSTFSKYFSKSGKKYYLESHNSLQRINNKNYVFSISRDITTKIEKEILIEEEINIKISEIENQKIFLDTLLQSNPTAIFYKDKDGKYLGCNKAWEKLTGIDKDSVLNKSVFDVAPNDIAKIYFEQDKKVLSLEQNPQIYQSEVYNKSLDKRFDVVFYKSAYFNSNGEVIGLIGVVIDVTEVIALEKEKEKKEKIIYQQSKMAAMGEMIENIAHQWRQPLSTMTVSASGIKMQKEFGILEDKSLNEFLDAILDSANHLSQTIDDFKNFFKSKKIEEEFDIKNTIKKTLTLLSSKFKNRHIKIIKNIHSVKIYSLQNELIHVILNILNNANDALEETNLKQKLIFVNTKKDKNNLIIEIIDNAGGIKEEYINKIFDAYFSTKDEKKGTGIGLYMSKEIITNHLNGNIKVQNYKLQYKEKNYTGAKFTITLPL